MIVLAKITAAPPPEELAKELPAILREEFETTGRQWHRDHLPAHFTPAGARLYGYQPREPGYERRKLKKFGHQTPLVFSGAMRDQLRQAARLTSTKKGVRVALTGPKYLYAYRKNYKQPDKAQEILRTGEDESAILALDLNKRVTARLAALRTAQTIQPAAAGQTVGA